MCFSLHSLSILIGFLGVSDVSLGTLLAAPHTYACASIQHIYCNAVAHQRMIFNTLCNYPNAMQADRMWQMYLGKNNKQLCKNYNVYLICDTLHTFFGSTMQRENKQWNLM